MVLDRVPWSAELQKDEWKLKSRRNQKKAAGSTGTTTLIPHFSYLINIQYPKFILQILSFLRDLQTLNQLFF
jgi:endonuclease IV